MPANRAAVYSANHTTDEHAIKATYFYTIYPTDNSTHDGSFETTHGCPIDATHIEAVCYALPAAFIDTFDAAICVSNETAIHETHDTTIDATVYSADNAAVEAPIVATHFPAHM